MLHRSLVRAKVACVAWTALALIGLQSVAAPAHACDTTVSADDGAAALQAAIDASAPGAEVCITPGGGLISLTGTPIQIDQDLTLTGPGSSLLTIDAGGASRVLQIGAVTTISDVHVSGLTLQNGSTLSGSCGTGGGVIMGTSQPDVLLLEDVVVDSSTCEGIRVQNGSLTLLRSTVSNTNPGPGIVIASGSGTQRIIESALIDNVSTLAGGALNNSSSSTSVIIENSTVSGNQSTRGGGLRAGNGSLSLFNTTVTNNTASIEAGGIRTTGTTVTLSNSVVAGNTPDDCFTAGSGGYSAGDHNLFELGGGCPSGQTTDVEVASIAGHLDALADNGGATPTHGLPAGSAAIDAGAAACSGASAALGNDQRGAARPEGSACDIGAHESGSPTLSAAPLVHDFGSVTLGESDMTVVTISNDGNDVLTVSSLGLSGSSAFSASLPATPLTLHFDETLDIAVDFTPVVLGVVNGTLSVAADGSNPSADVLLVGEGVIIDPGQQAQDLLDFVDASLADGSLFGVGPGNSAAQRPKAFRNKIEAVGDLIAGGETEEACGQLADVRNRADGERKPPDFVAGPATAEVLDRIDTLAADLGCS